MRIECPDCRQRFDVTEELMNKTVECGACNHEFKVIEDVQVKEKKKFYPGEKRGVNLDKFARGQSGDSGTLKSAKSVSFEKASYQPDVNVNRVGPVRPRRTIAAILGVCLMVFMMLVFLLAGGKDGAMRDMETTNRFVLVGFSAFLGCGLLLYGMVQNKLRGVLMCLVLGGGLLAMPVLFPGNPTSASSDNVSQLQKLESPTYPGQSDQSGLVVDEQDYKSLIGYGPVADALERGPAESVIAVYLRNAPQLVRDKISEYLYLETGKVSRGISYTRQRGFDNLDLFGLLVMENQKMSLDEVAKVCRCFGRVNKVDRDLRVIDVTVAQSKTAKLTEALSLDQGSTDYYRQLLEALQSFDSEVQMKAVKSLGVSEPKILRDDITKALVKILPASRSDLQLEIIHALKVWSKPGDGAGVAVLAAVKDLHKAGKVDGVAMSFLIERGVDGSEKVLVDLWNSNPVEWSDLMLQLGEGAQVLLLPELKKMDNEHIVVASDILGKVGLKSCVPYLEGVMSSQSPVGKKSLQAAIDEIKKRH